MQTRRPLCIGLSLATTWLSGNGWRRPGSRAEDIHSADFYVGLARKAERARLDFLFRPDALCIEPDALAGSPAFSSLDPTVLLAALARETRRIGLVTTASTSFHPPYLLARQLQSLHHVSQGRAGWNVVTSIDGHRNFGLAQMPPSPQRYEKALECVALVRQLWDSYPHGALRVDRERGRFADPASIRRVAHAGVHFSVEGPLNVPTHPAGAPPLFQAGASPAGRDFAARIADGVFAASPDTASGVELRRDLRSRAQRHGRAADDIRVLPGLSLYLADTEARARELYQDTRAPQEHARALQVASEALGIDLRALPDDQPITVDRLPPADRPVRSRTHADLMRRLVERDSPTVSQLLERAQVAGSAHWLVVGTPQQAFAHIRERHHAGALDGVIALPGGDLASLDLFLGQVVPRLQEAGLFRSEYRGSTLRSHLCAAP